MLMWSGPHQTNIGKRELRQMPTAICRLCGQACIGPSGVDAHSKSATRAAISLGWALRSRDRMGFGFGSMASGKTGEWLKDSEAVEPRWVLHEYFLPRRLVARPLLQQIEQHRIVG